MKSSQLTTFHATMIALVAMLHTTSIHAQTATSDDAAELTKKLQNPIASLISVPIQNNWDFGIGQTDATRYTADNKPAGRLRTLT